MQELYAYVANESTQVKLFSDKSCPFIVFDYDMSRKSIF